MTEVGPIDTTPSLGAELTTAGAARGRSAAVPGINDIAGLCAAVPLLYAESETAMDDDAVDAACEVEERIMDALASMTPRDDAEAAAVAGLLVFRLVAPDGGTYSGSERDGALLASLARYLQAQALEGRAA